LGIAGADRRLQRLRRHRRDCAAWTLFANPRWLFTHKSQDILARKNDFVEAIDKSTDFRFWHLCDIPSDPENVCLSGQIGSDRQTVKTAL
jgi:hypothetical protein